MALHSGSNRASAIDHIVQLESIGTVNEQGHNWRLNSKRPCSSLGRREKEMKTADGQRGR